MSDVSARVQNFLNGIAKLRPEHGIVFHGVADGFAPVGVFTSRGIIPASRNVRVATENFAVGAVVAIVVRTGRDLRPLSAHPAEWEVVLLPQVSYTVVGGFHVESAGIDVLVWEELTPPPVEPIVGLPTDPQGLFDLIERTVATAHERQAVAITNPGKFVCEIVV